MPDIPCTGDFHVLDPLGFWSYARQDDAQSDGQLSQLRAIVGKAIVLQYGTEVTLGQDISAMDHPGSHRWLRRQQDRQRNRLRHSHGSHPRHYRRDPGAA
jgi:hypothetical protein